MGTCHSILHQGSQEGVSVGRDPMLTPALSADDILVEDLGSPRCYHLDHFLKDNYEDNNGYFRTKLTNNADKKKPGLCSDGFGVNERSNGLHGLNENARRSVDEDRQRYPVDTFTFTKKKSQRPRDLQREERYGVRTFNAGFYRYTPRPLADNDAELIRKNTTYSSRVSPDFNDYYWQPQIYKSNPQQNSNNKDAQIRSTYKSAAHSKSVARNKFGRTVKDKFAEERGDSRAEVCISDTKRYINSTLFGHRKVNDISPRNSKECSVKPNICRGTRVVDQSNDLDIGFSDQRNPTLYVDEPTHNAVKLGLGVKHPEEELGDTRDKNNDHQPLSAYRPCKQHEEFTCKDGSGGSKQHPFVKGLRKMSANSANMKENRHISGCLLRDNRQMSAKTYLKNAEGVLNSVANRKIGTAGSKRINCSGIFTNSDAWVTPRETAEKSVQDRIVYKRGCGARNRINSANRIYLIQEKQKFMNEFSEQREAQNSGTIDDVTDYEVMKTNISAQGRVRADIVKKLDGEQIIDAEEAFGDDLIGIERCKMSTLHQNTSEKVTASDNLQDKQNLSGDNGATAIDSHQVFNKYKFGTVAFFERTRRANAAFKEHLAGITPHVDSWNVAKTKPEKPLHSDVKERALEDAKIGSCTFYELQIQKQAEVRKMLKNTSTRLNTWQSNSIMNLCRGKGFKLKQ